MPTFAFYLGARLAGEILLKKLPWFWKKSTLYVHIYGLNSQLKRTFKSILEKKHKTFFLRDILFYVVHETFIQVPLLQENFPAPKNCWLRACNFINSFSQIVK